MCRTNPVTKDHIAQMRSSLLRRLENPDLSAEQREMLQTQYEYVVANVTEKEGSEAPATTFVIGT